jgi:hypothetical protein
LSAQRSAQASIVENTVGTREKIKWLVLINIDGNNLTSALTPQSPLLLTFFSFRYGFRRPALSRRVAQQIQTKLPTRVAGIAGEHVLTLLRGKVACDREVLVERKANFGRTPIDRFITLLY